MFFALLRACPRTILNHLEDGTQDLVETHREEMHVSCSSPVDSRSSASSCPTWCFSCEFRGQTHQEQAARTASGATGIHPLVPAPDRRLKGLRHLAETDSAAFTDSKSLCW